MDPSLCCGVDLEIFQELHFPCVVRYCENWTCISVWEVKCVALLIRNGHLQSFCYLDFALDPFYGRKRSSFYCLQLGIRSFNLLVPVTSSFSCSVRFSLCIFSVLKQLCIVVCRLIAPPVGNISVHARFTTKVNSMQDLILGSIFPC